MSHHLESDTPIVSRPHSYAWLCLVGMLIGIGLAAVAYTQLLPKDWFALLFFSLMGALMFVGGIASGIYAARFRIVADKNGLRLRDLRPERFIPWSEITDYYEQVPPPKNKFAGVSGLRNVVETATGHTFAVSSDWSNLLLLKMRIEERAEATKAIKPNGTTGWALHGTRPHELPLTLGYDEGALRRELRQRLRVSYISLALFLLLMLILRATEVGYLEHLLFPFQMGVVLTCLVLVVTASLSPSIKRQYQDGITRAKRGERFQADPDGLTVNINGDERHIAWSSIIGWEARFGKVPGSGSHSMTTFLVRTDCGYEFTLTDSLPNLYLFFYVMTHYAPDAIERRADRNRQEALGTIADRWTGGEEAQGGRVFHARTRSNRALLFLPWVFCGAALFIAYLNVSGLLSVQTSDGHFLARNPTGALTLGTLSALTGAGMVWRYFRTQITVGPRGITQVLPWCRKSIGWANVARWSVEGDTGIIEAHDGARIRWAPSLLAYGSEIEGLIDGYVRSYRAKAAKESDTAMTAMNNAQENAPVLVNRSASQAR